MVWSILFLLVGLVIFGLELFIPSGGVLGVVAFLALGASLWFAFGISTQYGLAMLIAVFILIPVFLSQALRVWPRTPIGKRILGDRLPTAEATLPAGGLRDLQGQYGVAQSNLWPNGEVLIDGQRYGAVSEGKPIDSGQPIRVMTVDMNRLVVSFQEPPPTPHAEQTEEELLSRPVDEIISDPFIDPDS